MRKFRLCEFILITTFGLLLFLYPANIFAQYSGTVDCGVGGNCSPYTDATGKHDCTLKCNSSVCGSGNVCTCLCDTGQPPPGTVNGCASDANCVGGAPCPANANGTWACIGGQCQSFCGGGNTKPQTTPPPPGVNTPTPTPILPPTCNQNWNCGTCTGSPATMACVDNCGNWLNFTCVGTINARAVVVNSSATCADVQASTTALTGTVTHQFTSSASNPNPKTQSGATAVTFSGIPGGTYNLATTVPANYNLFLACWRTVLNAPTSGTGLTNTLSEPIDNDTLTWDVGYTAGSPWVQTQGGNVYAAVNVKSYIPVGVLPRVFAKS